MRTITGTKNGRNTSAYSARPDSTTVAICIIDSTPDGYIEANVPPRMTTADRMTVPMFRMACRIASRTSQVLFSLNLAIRKML
ncbi:hypothetical protein D3C75_1333970 [compost metagenome]